MFPNPLPAGCGLALALAAGVAVAQPTTTFFSARGQERCEVVARWGDEIQARAPGVDFYNQVDIHTGAAVAAPSFADPTFAAAFGKRFADLSGRELEAIGKALVECWGSDEGNSFDFFAQAFEPNPARRDRSWDERIAAATGPGQSQYVVPKVPMRYNALIAAQGANVLPPAALAGMRLVPCPDNRLEGRFFSEQIYTRSGGLADNDVKTDVANFTAIDCALGAQAAYMVDVLSTAAELFRRAVRTAGVTPADALHAMRDGRFHPHWDDVALAWRGIVPMDVKRLEPLTVAAMQREGHWKNGAPDLRAFEQLVRARRAAAWQETYGRYADLPKGDVVRVLFEALASGAEPPRDAVAAYDRLRADP